MAVVDFFLKIDGIPGESQDDKHKDEIQIESWSFAAAQEGTGAWGGGGGAGKVKMEDMHFTKVVDKATPKLMLACATGEHLPKATLICRKAGKQQQEYLKITLTDCLVSHINAGSGGGVLPQDQFSLNFSKIEFDYKQQNKDGTLGGSVKVNYDLKSMKANA